MNTIKVFLKGDSPLFRLPLEKGDYPLFEAF
jgi:hypothetical protein